MKASPTAKWIVDAALLVGYCVAVWLDLTGLELHQWLGVGVGLLAGYHLLTHWEWVTAVTRRFFGKTSPRARLYYLIDALMLGGFVIIGVTGLLISTWLNLTLVGMASLAAMHKWTAYLTLAALGVKLALHWRWIVSVAGKFVQAPATHHPPAGSPSAAQATRGGASDGPGMLTRGYTRRESLKLIGVAAFSTVAVVGVVAKTLEALQARDNGSTSTVAELATATALNASPASASVAPPAATTTATPVPFAMTVAAAPTATTTTASVAAVSVACISCRRGKHCSYPGDCRDYVDTNGNNRCDRGECA